MIELKETKPCCCMSLDKTCLWIFLGLPVFQVTSPENTTDQDYQFDLYVI